MGFQLKFPQGAANNYYFNPDKPGERYDVTDDERPHMTSRYWRPCLLRDGQLVPTTEKDYGPDICCDFVHDFMDRHRDRPFFLYYPMILTHGPNEPAPETPGIESMSMEQKRKGDNANFPYMVEHIDKNVGQVLSKLKDLGLKENTLVMFTGDNGTMMKIETHSTRTRPRPSSTRSSRAPASRAALGTNSMTMAVFTMC